MFSSSHVELPGVRLVYLEAGRGPLVVLWHGFPDSADTWKASAEKLVARGRRVVMPYLRGYFPSGLAASYDGPALWGDAIGLLDKLGEERATLVGHDWGAFVVQGTAALSGLYCRGVGHWQTVLLGALRHAWKRAVSQALGKEASLVC